MNVMQKFNQYVTEKNLRHSDQRQKVVEVFLSTERHISIQELSDLVRKKHEGIGYATVARAVRLMSDSGLCRQVDFGDGVQRFEHKFGHEHHDHLVCLNCGRFVEVFSPKLEKLQDQFVKKHGYIQEYHKLHIFGICPKCAKKKKSKARK